MEGRQAKRPVADVARRDSHIEGVQEVHGRAYWSLGGGHNGELCMRGSGHTWMNASASDFEFKKKQRRVFGHSTTGQLNAPGFPATFQDT